MGLTMEKKAARQVRREAKVLIPALVAIINAERFGRRVRLAWHILRAKVQVRDLADEEVLARDPNGPRPRLVMLPQRR